MTVLDARFYRDPLQVLLDEEERTCRGCVHTVTTTILGKDYLTCSKDRRHGNRCRLYNNPTETQ